MTSFRVNFDMYDVIAAHFPFELVYSWILIKNEPHFIEGFKIAPPAVQNIIRACNQDIRQTINTLSMMASNNNSGKKVKSLLESLF